MEYLVIANEVGYVFFGTLEQCRDYVEANKAIRQLAIVIIENGCVKHIECDKWW